MTKVNRIFNYLDIVEGEGVTENKDYPVLVSKEFDVRLSSARVYVSRWRGVRGIAKKYKYLDKTPAEVSPSE